MEKLFKDYLIDFDKVTASNLNRCVFFSPQDHEKTYKVDAIHREIERLYPDTQIIPIKMPVQQAPGEIWQVPIIVVAVDNNEARHFINMMVLSLENKPFIVNGAMGRTFYEVQVLLPGTTACMVCPWSKSYVEKMFARMVRQDCDEFFHKTTERFPAISVISSLLGGVMAGEIVKLLVGGRNWRESQQWCEDLSPALGKSLRYDIRNHETSCGKIYRNPNCCEIFCKKSQK